ncbi:MAG: hypothetical protein AVO35_01275 [Candidatus Aegiribacteria sp. MLS_C]|nr:MAG: hypothetical protein AVO35_01275 [Candidatus Aegiribacteria sp. MLS_C]
MEEALDLGLGDPRCTNAPGREAQAAMEDLGSRVSKLVNGRATVFSVDGCLASAMAVLAAGRAARARGAGHVVASPVESAAVVGALRLLQEEGSRVSVMDSDRRGFVGPDSLGELLAEDTGLLVCCLADGVCGTVQPLKELSGLLDPERTWVHCECSWAAGRVPVDMEELGVDSASFSSVQLGGPPGSGAVTVRRGRMLSLDRVPEFALSTNLPASFGMVAAMESRFGCVGTSSGYVEELREETMRGLDSCGLSYSIIGGEGSLPGTGLLRLKGRFDRVHARLEREGVILPSHNSTRRLSFLRRTGWDVSMPDRYLGFSLDTFNTGLDVEYFLRALASVLGS